MPNFEKLTLPKKGSLITFNNGTPSVPDDPIVPFIRGDGTGVDIWPATQNVIDQAILKSYGNQKKLIGLKFMLVMKRAKFTALTNIFLKIPLKPLDILELQ